MMPAMHQDPELHRPRLFGIAYRMLGDVQEAEDVVQDALLRWHQADTSFIREPAAWLVTVTTRLAIDRQRKLSTERSSYVGPWLPEPIAPEQFAADYQAELASDLTMAFLVLLERLAPEERAAFLLREVFGSAYAEIADVLQKSEAAVRQMVHRARERVRADRPRFDTPPDATDRLFSRFLAALENDDKEAMLAVLAADAEWTSDGGGKIAAARRVIHGGERIARMLLTIETKYDHPFTYRMGRRNGEPAILQYVGDALLAVTFCATDGERITGLYRVLNPDKLAFAR